MSKSGIFLWAPPGKPVDGPNSQPGGRHGITRQRGGSDWSMLQKITKKPPASGKKQLSCDLLVTFSAYDRGR